MKITLLQEPQFIRSQWSGGTTTQLFISPPGASYAAGDFDVRISSTTVEAEESTFTSLPGVSRKLMILEGALEISHQTHYDKALAPFDVDAFEGDWHTTGRGRCIDFNVMTKDGRQSSLAAVHHSKGDFFDIIFNQEHECILLYIWQGSLYCPAQAVEAVQGEALLLESNGNGSVHLEATDNSTIVVTRIYRDR